MSDKLAKRPEGGHESPFTRIRRVSAAGTPIPRWGYNGAPKCRRTRRLAKMVVHPKGIGEPSPPDLIRGERAPKGGGPSVWLCQRRGREWPSQLGNKGLLFRRSTTVAEGTPSPSRNLGFMVLAHFTWWTVMRLVFPVLLPERAMERCR